MKILRLAAVAVVLVTAVAWMPAPAAASDSSDVMATIDTAISSFNKGDGKSWLATCSSSTSIVSNIPPYQYSSCASWWSTHAAADKKNGISGENVTLGKAWCFLVNGDRAYAAFPGDLAYERKGKAMKMSGVLTIALQKGSNGWLMTGWSWSAKLS